LADVDDDFYRLADATCENGSDDQGDVPSVGDGEVSRDFDVTLYTR
jgi:hypothetical protein